MSLARRAQPEPQRRGWCPSLARPMPTGDGLLARVHPPLGRLSPAQLRAITEGARRFGNGHVDITSRANLQIRGVTPVTTAPLADLLAAAGLGDRRHDGGPQRLTLTSPLAGLDPSETIDVLALALAIEEAALEIVGLPAKTLVAIEGMGVDGSGADVVMRAHADGAVAINLAGGGQASTVPADLAVETVIGLLRTFVETGQRRIRDLTPTQRLALALASEAHAKNPPPSAGEGGPRVSEGRERGTISSDASLPSPPRFAGTLPRKGGRGGRCASSDLPLGRFALAGAHLLAVEATFGRCDTGMLEQLAETADALDCAQIRPSPSRGFVLACADRRAAGEALKRLASLGFVTSPDDPRRAIAACPGAPACASGSTPVPVDAARLAAAFAPFAARGLEAHVSGCAKGCAHPQSAKLTLVAEGGRYGVVLDGGPRDAPLSLLTIEAVAERLSRADPSLPLFRAFDI